MAAEDAAYAAILGARNADTAYMPCRESGRFAMCRLASILRVQARADEPVFRFGGEEFLVILHATNESAAHAVERADTALPSAKRAGRDRWSWGQV